MLFHRHVHTLEDQLQGFTGVFKTRIPGAEKYLRRILDLQKYDPDLGWLKKLECGEEGSIRRGETHKWDTTIKWLCFNHPHLFEYGVVGEFWMRDDQPNANGNTSQRRNVQETYVGVHAGRGVHEHDRKYAVSRCMLRLIERNLLHPQPTPRESIPTPLLHHAVYYLQ
jgi:hypothetical protein